ncbi:uncharacterized protein YydD (DUF2326 family) [Sphingomonas zeicaulis]|uniref:DUF2326 domain-containing protein n=1 Tax=Sphingomonas zeicaulis TaxID=1632740 RepID=UPI003D1D297F
MLHRLSADRPSFQTIEFRPGLNILLTTKSATTPEKGVRERLRTRNGAGKSSVIEILHFLLGGQHHGALKAAILAEWLFTLDLDAGPRTKVSRSVAGRKTVLVESGVKPADGLDLVLPALPKVDRILNSDWCDLLGERWFRLDADRQKGAASFRKMMAYFARRRRDGGFENPVHSRSGQSAADTQTTLAELFGLDAELVRRLHEAKAAIKKLDIARKTLAEMEAMAPQGRRKVDLEAEIAAQIAAAKLSRDRLDERVREFNVLPAFRELEYELASLNQLFRDLSDRDVIDQEVVTINERALAAEAPGENTDLLRLFEEARLVFPDRVLGRYEEVQSFHRQLVEHRQAHLRNELHAARRRIENRQPQRERLEQRRREIAAALRSSGPAETLLQLQNELAEQRSVVSGLEARLSEAKTLEDQFEQLGRDAKEAAQAVKQDKRERSTIVEQASTTFSAISERLFEKPGTLAISADDDGLRFVPTTPSDQSAGVMSMEIFCFDWTLATIAHQRGRGPGFLIHDSHLFEPVDGRQFARALTIAAEFSRETGIQYVALLNSDELARAEREGDVSFSEYVLDTVLSDSPEGGLFGIRFD